jgi:hypothetical protein
MANFFFFFFFFFRARQLMPGMHLSLRLMANLQKHVFKHNTNEYTYSITSGIAATCFGVIYAIFREIYTKI